MNMGFLTRQCFYCETVCFFWSCHDSGQLTLPKTTRQNSFMILTSVLLETTALSSPWIKEHMFDIIEGEIIQFRDQADFCISLLDKMGGFFSLLSGLHPKSI